MNTCVICNKPFEEYGNNPYPIKSEGECCNECDCLKVIPERLRRIGIPNEAAIEIGQKDLNLRNYKRLNPNATIQDLINQYGKTESS